MNDDDWMSGGCEVNADDVVEQGRRRYLGYSRLPLGYLSATSR
eukprot:CAMPEP_0185299128 /NCGR_PEP_ID=MMETSP1363-20130426/11053_1 /TAXON_ID=38817 /ORGANISM="Gephyrocapsa oceanica, Strain RCC1303" /LENGTH=42 /DNA_ID= /DNA_START= /DNA_END= /DNA_ORIENTATION=